MWTSNKNYFTKIISTPFIKKCSKESNIIFCVDTGSSSERKPKVKRICDHHGYDLPSRDQLGPSEMEKLLSNICKITIHSVSIRGPHEKQVNLTIEKNCRIFANELYDWSPSEVSITKDTKLEKFSSTEKGPQNGEPSTAKMQIYQE